MAISARLKQFLDGARARYEVIKHPVVYTAQEIAAAEHVPGRQLAKSVLVNTDRGPTLAVLPATHLVDFKKLKQVLRAKTVSIGKEPDIKRHFPDVEVGAMSPFGHLYQVPVVIDQALSSAETIVFNGGSHTDTIRMRYQDFVSLAKPSTGEFGQPRGDAKGGKKPVKTKKPRAAAKRSTPARSRRTGPAKKIPKRRSSSR